MSDSLGNANTTGANFGGALSAAGGALAGLTSRSAVGKASGALQASQLAAGKGLFGANSNAVNGAANTALGALNIYTGLKQGGIKGDLQAANGAYGLATGTGGIPGVGQALSLYNAVSNYKSGATGNDALLGAQAGASIGSIVPGVGTLIGGAIGGAVGAIASAFGPGAKDPETVGVQKLLDVVGAHPDQASQITSAVQNPYIALAGLFDRHESTLPVYAQYGRKGEYKFTTDLVNKINSTPGVKGMSSDQIYKNVVAPWVNSMGGGWGNVGSTYTQTTQGLIKQMVDQYVSGSAQSDWKAVGGDSPFKNLPAFGTAG